MTRRRILAALTLLPFAALDGAAWAQDAKPAQGAKTTALGKPMPTFGHSMQGEAFDEGPRRRATLLPGMAKIVFPVTSRSPKTRPFVEQGIGQLHAYWYFEAERSFRQAAYHDPDCAIAYWGMAMANVNNEKRAKAFVAEAVERKAKASPRERAYIEALDAYLNGKQPAKEKDAAYAAALRAIVEQNPIDLEAKALLAHILLEGHFANPGRDNAAERLKGVAAAREVDALLKDILAVNPEHPVHHYRIHLWDFDLARGYALDSAASCGLAEPGIAHMWHMCGHTYSGLKRYDDAAYYQEASARVDHAHMIRAGILPDQIHNYAHNNQWLIETLVYVGRANDALRLGRNMVALPRHPAYNRLGEYGSTELGRMRLMQTVVTFELWPQAFTLLKEGAFDDGGKPRLRLERLFLTAAAAFGSGDVARGRAARAELEALVPDPSKAPEGVDLEQWKAMLAEVKAREAVATGDTAAAARQVAALPTADPRLWSQIGNRDEALKAARAAVEASPGQVVPLATLVETLWNAGKRDEAKERFETLRTVAGRADLDTPPIARLAPIARALNLPADWRRPAAPAADTGYRPPLESLGPLLWQGPMATDFTLPDVAGKRWKLSDLRRDGRPTLVLFYLGSGCERCMAQLNAFAPRAAAFDAAGIRIVAVSTDSRDMLGEAKTKDGKPFPFPVLADPAARSFRAFGAYDDFEDMALHGAFLIDGSGRVRWQDIGFRPFEDAGFVLEESKRLLAQK